VLRFGYATSFLLQLFADCTSSGRELSTVDGLFVLMRAEGIKNGLDFEQAVNDPEMVEMVTSTQVLHAWCSRATKYSIQASD
jgi:hypothetical protein